MRKLTKEEYIEAIQELQGRGRARTGAIARRMGVRPPSVTQMLAKLAAEGLVEHEPYNGARLTGKGERLAAELSSRHRTIAEFLEMLGVERARAEADACLIEHEMSRESAETLGRFVEYVRGSGACMRQVDGFRRRA